LKLALRYAKILLNMEFNLFKKLNIIIGKRRGIMDKEVFEEAVIDIMEHFADLDEDARLEIYLTLKMLIYLNSSKKARLARIYAENL